MGIVIDKKHISRNHEPYIIAEISANHNGSLETALKTIEAAKMSGASAVKLQTYTPDTMTIECDSEDFKIINGTWAGYNLYQLYKEAHTPFEWHEKLFEFAKSIGISIFSTPFDETAVELLESLNTPAYKIASFEVTDLPLIKRVASTGKPIIISTGLATKEEVTEAVSTAKRAGCQQLILLHCVSSYPAPTEESNLLRIQNLSRDFNVTVGLSDHTLDSTAAIASVSLGAALIEKHFTLDRSARQWIFSATRGI